MNDAEQSTDAPDQADLAERALALKQENAEPAPHPPADDTPNEGLRPLPREDYPPSGAFDAEGQRPVLERSRKVR